MLRELVVEGLGVIERTEVTIESGMTALTGETGAGKTLIVAAVALLLGGRADREVVRQDSGEARVEGRFEVPAGHPAAEVLAAHGFLEDGATGGELVVHRTVGMTGGGRVRINGRLSSIQMLGDVMSSLVEIAGQHEHQRLSRSAVQRDLLDAFAGAEAVALASEIRAAVRELNEVERRLDALKAASGEREREIERLEHESGEIGSTAPVVGEWDALTEEARRLEAAAEAAAGTAEARDSVRGEGGAVEALERASTRLREAASADPELSALASRLEAAAIEVADVGDELVRRVVDPDPERLAEIRERLDALTRLRRRYGSDEAAVLAHAESARERLASLRTETDDEETLTREAERLRREASDAAARLGALRRDAAQRLGEEVTGLLARLGMSASRFEVAVGERELYEGGTEGVELLLAAGSDEARSLTKVASGGELSRIALALHLLVRGGAAPTLIFDEVDAGVGGEAALAVAEALGELGGPTRQVLVVTHLAQVAARANHQLRVTKEAVGSRIRARVTAISGEERVDEISRMLSGMPDSDSARDHARELLGMPRSGAA